MEKSVVVNTDACIGCGLCKKDCVAFAIQIEDGKAVWNPKSCIYCGHCQAICPQGAIQLKGFNDEIYEYEEKTILNPDELMKAIQTRRTIRSFTEEKISDTIVDQIIEAGRLAPTGGNGQGTSYIVLQNKIEDCEAIAVDMFRKGFKLGKGLISFIQNMEIDDHFFFKKAPLVIVICGKDKVSASLAAQNMAFMAEANNLGVLFSGFFTTCVNLSNKLKKMMCMDKSEKAVTTLVIGYPAYKYHRTVHRKGAKVRKL